ncbi:MAG TPA: hypothetical protein VLY04_03910 [Bryobacteraceae bacterium]|nr:hypothetical protein [Bryobacteraceae bacterium]
MGQYSRAERELSRALELTQPTALILSNLSYAQFWLGRMAEARQSAQQAVRTDADYAPGQLMLGVLLAQDRAMLGEAIPHLELAARTLPTARAALDEARRELAAGAR